ncbi:CMRF35-like molecule 5 [Esox lucius]|uniref:CMRF35-like molecule 5 n=1 Tax=Esox lucius TaxID=8010 RepID=UPI0014768FE7|nr:CMRF35-like molecule 5 [Esox lucius]
MRKLISVIHFLLCAGVCVTSEVITRRGQEGGSTSIECPYDQGWETYTKYFYKGIWAHRVPVIQSNQPSSWTSNGRYSLYDDRERRVFTVIISNLTLQDTDTYWCFIDGWGFHPLTEVKITVDRAPPPSLSAPPPTPKSFSFTSRPLPSVTHPSAIITMVTGSDPTTGGRTNGIMGVRAAPRPTDTSGNQEREETERREPQIIGTQLFNNQPGPRHSHCHQPHRNQSEPRF